ncbi:hypothetical protein FOE74_13475 [Rufibacter glacialis]|uniref:Uncharacterized protein n=2 Tax=Rufibacter glacialis TaxID=1259555 RepID=A0A5M8QC89_9BACT|nr:hypothetical protein FOE74_13475 [Rufibacter glacialis]
MEKLRKIKLELHEIKSKARKIFRRGYEDLTMMIYYHDLKDQFQLLIINPNNLLLLEKEITRAEAFRIMNTRNS